jgi:hypothetical protein
MRLRRRMLAVLGVLGVAAGGLFAAASSVLGDVTV